MGRTKAPAAGSRAVLVAVPAQGYAATGVARRAVPGREGRRAGMAFSCPAVAHSIAPGPTTHRIYVTPLVLRWSLGLADAVCCSLVVEVRSGPHARVGPLGFFLVFVALALSLACPWAASATTSLVILSAPFHARPEGHAGAASSIARTAARLAD